MKKKQYKINTTKLRELIASKGYTVKQLAREAGELTGISPHTLNGHILGASYLTCITPDEVAAYSAILNENEATIKKAFGFKDQSSVLNGKYVKFDTKRLLAAIGKKTQHTIECDAGLSQGTLHRIIYGASTDRDKALKICEVLKKSPEELIVNYTSDTSQTPQKPVIQSVEGVLDVFSVFKIMNGNLEHLMDAINANTTNTDALKGLEDRIDNLTGKVDSIAEALVGLSKMLTDGKTALPREEREATTPELAVTVPNETKLKYDPNDSLDAFAAKTDTFIKKIAAHRNLTMNQIRHDYYETMKKTYGVVWEQLQKDYYNKHGKKQTWALALLYDNGLFGQIYFNILSAEYSRVCKKSA